MVGNLSVERVIAMQTFIVTIERMERRKVRVAGGSPDDALALIRQVLPEGARALTAVPMGLPSPDLGQKMLDRLLGRDFMELAGLKDAPIDAWLRAAALPDLRPVLNETLALAGMRVTEDADGILWLWVGSPQSIPLLSAWVADHMAPSMFLPALQAIEGATRPRGMTFAGIKARAVGVPLDRVIRDLVHVPA